MNSPTRKTHPLLKIMNSVLVDLPAPNNLSTMWNFGSLLGLCLIIQLLTGLFLAMHYTPHIDMAFMSCAHITRDVNYGWMIRNFHANGASWFFICLYIHIGRGIYFASFRLMHVWNIGIVLFIATMAAAFLGYVLPWGQMSFWGATVITNLMSAIPYIGHPLVQWMWGGFAVDNATLNRFFALHFFVPFIIAALSAIHIMFLHQTGSSNPLGLNSNSMKTTFHWAYTSKDIPGIFILLLTLSMVCMFFPNMFGDPENWTPANPMLTPLHIKPEWYFLWAYAILRSIPNKLGGVVAMFSAMLILFTLPFIFSRPQNSSAFCPPLQIIFWIFIAICLLLTWIGGRPIEEPFDWLGQMFTMLYFMFFLVTPLTYMLWNKIIN